MGWAIPFNGMGKRKAGRNLGETKKVQKRQHKDHHLSKVDLLVKKRQRKYFQENNPGSQTRNQNEKKVLRALLDHPKGLGTIPLSRETVISRKNIPLICKGLIKRNLVVKGKGKRGLYKITTEVSNDPAFMAFLFEEGALKRVLGNATFPSDIFRFHKICMKHGIDGIVTSGSRFCNNELAQEIEEDHRRLLDKVSDRHRKLIGEEEYSELTLEEISNYNKRKMPSSHLLDYDSLAIFEFANRIGFYMTYVLLQALNPNINRLHALDHSTTSITPTKDNSNNKTGNSTGNSIEANGERWSLAWINNVIKPRNLLEEFTKQDFFQEGLKPQTDGFSVPKLSQSDFDHLAWALAAAYPSIYYKEIDAIRRGLMDYIVEVSKHHQKRQDDAKSFSSSSPSTQGKSANG